METEAAGEAETPLAAEVEIAVAAAMLFVARAVGIAAEAAGIGVVAAGIAAVREADEKFYEKLTITAADIDNRRILTRAGCNDSQYD